MIKYQNYLLIGALVTFSMCSTVEPENKPHSENPTSEFKALWYDGNAEVAVYELEQARYGEVHKGQVSMVFVSEPFSNTKHVKLDNPQNNEEDKVDILKLNVTRKFNTGIYPYSLMTSVFSPVDQAMGVMKVSTSAQEWCGHSYVQINANKQGYHVDQKSYFETEGDLDFELSHCLLEDNIWTQIRINPSHLPLGEINIVPGTQSMRLRHNPTKAIPANATQEVSVLNTTYSLEYADRKLEITFQTSFPHTILSWKETYRSGWGENAKDLTSSGKLTAMERLPYWKLNHLADSTYRELLMLE